MTRPLQALNLGLPLSFPAETAIAAVEDLPLAGMLQALELADRQMATQVKEREEALLLLSQKLEGRIEMLTKENAALRVQLETSQSQHRETMVLQQGEVDALNKLVETAKAETALSNQLRKQETDALKGHIKILVDTAHSSANSIAAISKDIRKNNQDEVTRITSHIAQVKANPGIWGMDSWDLQHYLPAQASDIQFHQSLVDKAAKITSHTEALANLQEKK